MKDSKNICKNVVSLCTAFPQVKTNYNELLKFYWIIYDHIMSVRDIPKATPAESITRTFRRLVKSGVITIPEKDAQARKEKEKEYRSEFSLIL